MTDNNKDDEAEALMRTVDLRLTIPEVSRRRLRALAALYGTTMADLVDSLIDQEWHGSEPEAEEHAGRMWYDADGTLRNPDGSRYDIHEQRAKNAAAIAEFRAEQSKSKGGAR